MFFMFFFLYNVFTSLCLCSPQSTGKTVYRWSSITARHINRVALDLIQTILNEPSGEGQHINIMKTGNAEDKVNILKSFRRNMTKINKYTPQDYISYHSKSTDMRIFS